MAMKMKYYATRCDAVGEQMEGMGFARKSDAVKWGKRCRYWRVRLQAETRPLVAGSF